ncbi:CopG family transcriptional regulator / antitoxin EndoAI [Clostridium sp. USBA 49]|uniref:CopG family ribbon-helix-helix protein n=1 Tax=Clostridium TaxID=1485 RepID=UPI000999F161|nr:MULTISPECIES: CopG family transcriptional regulator [Clostridium]SKA87155.1 CopG family transcriptional regulator / antitoxin EndoAI [Clostridium sp. USBA 49]
MAGSKKLVVNLNETLYNEFNKALEEDCKKRSEFIRDAIIVYIEEKKRLSLMDSMRKGYMEMAQLNLEIAEMGFANDVDELKKYEAKLAESDFPNDNDSEKRRYILC